MINWDCLLTEHKADSLTEYVKWIVDKGYAVIDVNVPKHVSREGVSLAVHFFVRAMN